MGPLTIQPIRTRAGTTSALETRQIETDTDTGPSCTQAQPYEGKFLFLTYVIRYNWDKLNSSRKSARPEGILS